MKFMSVKNKVNSTTKHAKNNMKSMLSESDCNGKWMLSDGRNSILTYETEDGGEDQIRRKIILISPPLTTSKRCVLRSKDQRHFLAE